MHTYICLYEYAWLLLENCVKEVFANNLHSGQLSLQLKQYDSLNKKVM